MLTLQISFDNVSGLYEARVDGGETHRFKLYPGREIPSFIINALERERHIAQLQSTAQREGRPSLNAEELLSALRAFESRGGRPQLCGVAERKSITQLSIDDLEIGDDEL